MVPFVANANRARRGAVVVLIAVLLVVLMGMVAFSIDMGYIVTVKSQLQRAADSAALAAAAVMNKNGLAQATATAERIGEMNTSSGAPVDVLPGDVVFGVWDLKTRTFTPSTPGAGGNAVKVRISQTPNLFFARVIGIGQQKIEAEAIAIATPRDIAFVVDLSGSMNDDTEPAWATGAINSAWASSGFGTVGNQVMQDIYNDFGFGAFPGTTQQIGHPLGSWYQTYRDYAYAELTKDGGPLAQTSTPTTYRILPTDTEAARKQKAYMWIIDNQIKAIMPKAVPTPDSSTNYAFWAKYIDYVIVSKNITLPPPPSSGGGGSSSGGGGGGGSGSSGGSGGSSGPSAPPPPSPPKIGWLAPSVPEDPVDHYAWASETAAMGMEGSLAGWLPGVLLGGLGQPPDNRGTIPPSIDSQTRLVGKFNNPNTDLYPSARAPTGFRNVLGYLTYIQFLMDHGRDLQPVSGMYAPHSLSSSLVPMHSETTKGGTFQFPPREQPAHACRRSMIAALEVIRQLNSVNPSPDQRDWVSIITFDKVNPGATIQQSLTYDYPTAMQKCTSFQAVGDRGASTATEGGLIVANNHLKPTSQGGSGREFSDKVVVLLTDGIPNAYTSSNATIDAYMSGNANSNFYGGGYYWLDAPLMQTATMQAKNWKVYPVGIGLGTDYNFMDRVARMGGSADKSGQSPRGSGNPAQYEDRLEQIFQDIIANAGVRLVR